MSMLVNIGEAKTRLSELVAAATGGEEVILARAGAPQVRLVAVAPRGDGEVERRAAKRQAGLGMWAHLVDGSGIDIRTLKNDDLWDEHYRRKFADLDRHARAGLDGDGTLAAE